MAVEDEGVFVKRNPAVGVRYAVGVRQIDLDGGVGEVGIAGIACQDIAYAPAWYSDLVGRVDVL